MKLYAWILLFLLAITTTTTAADLKVALIGDSPAANQTADFSLVKLSGRNGVSILERNEIDKILREHRLNKSSLDSDSFIKLHEITHVDIFAIINSAGKKDKVTVSSLVIYDAKTGFKLQYIPLPSNINNASDTITDTIKQTAENIHSNKKLSYVAILSAHNTAVNSRYKYAIANLSKEILRRLVASPQIAVLERSALGLVTKEREITGERYKLAPSSYLLDFEFTPGTAAGTVTLKLFIMSTSGRIVKQYNYNDCLIDSSSSCNVILSDIARFLNKPVSKNIPSSTGEARRYYREFEYCMQQKNFKTAAKKLDSAIALAPRNPLYQVALNRIIAKQTQGLWASEERFDKYLDAMEEILKNCDQIKRKFPSYRKPIYNYDQLNLRVYKLMATPNHLGVTQKRRAVELMNRIRSREFEEARNTYHKYDLSDGINSARELQNYHYAMIGSYSPWLYLDDDAAIKQYFRTIQALVEAYSKFNKNNPKPRQLKLFKFSGLYDDAQFLDAMTRQLKTPLALNAINTAGQYKNNSSRRFACYYSFLRNCAFNNYDKNYFTDNIKTMITNYIKYNNGKAPSIYLFYIIRNSKPQLYKIYLKTRKEVMETAYSSDSWEPLYSKLHNYKNFDDISRTLIENGETLQKWRRADGTKNRVDIEDHPACTLIQLTTKLTTYRDISKRKYDRTLAEKAFETLNKPLKVSKIHQVLSGKHDKIINAKEYKGHVYLLCSHDRMLSVVDFNLNTSAISKVFGFNYEFSGYYRGGTYTIRPFHVDDKYYIFGDGKKIICVSRTRNKVTSITDLPEGTVQEVCRLDNRIYAFIGKLDTFNILLSCNLDGSDRKVLISTLRRVKQNSFDSQKAFHVSGLFADHAKKRLVFAAGNGGLWAFSPSANKFTKLMSVKPTHRVSARKIKETIYLAAGRYYYYTYNITSNTYNFLYYNDSSCPKWLKKKPQYAQWLNIEPPFYSRGHELWVGYMINYINLAENNGMYRIYGLENGISSSAVHLMFPHPDGRSVYAISSKDILKITPPEKIDKKIK